MIFYIKNMVCLRCILKVESELEQVGITGAIIQLGRVELSVPATKDQINQLRIALADSGLEMMADKKSELVDRIKKVIRQMIEEPVVDPNFQSMTTSEYISEKLGENYACLAEVFSEATGMSVGQFIIQRRIAFTKTLIRQNVLSLSEIAFRLNYSSIGHLSNQFKKSTGIRPSAYRPKDRVRVEV